MSIPNHQFVADALHITDAAPRLALALRAGSTLAKAFPEASINQLRMMASRMRIDPYLPLNRFPELTNWMEARGL